MYQEPVCGRVLQDQVLALIVRCFGKVPVVTFSGDVEEDLMRKWMEVLLRQKSGVGSDGLSKAETPEFMWDILKHAVVVL